MMDILFHGVGWTDIALRTLNRIAVGMFFMFSGRYHRRPFNPERHRVFADELSSSWAFMPWASTNGGCRGRPLPAALFHVVRIPRTAWPRSACFVIILVAIVTAGAAAHQRLQAGR